MTTKFPTPTQCQACGERFPLRTGTFLFDAYNSKLGAWGNFCTSCFLACNGQLGIGKGQAYARKSDGKFYKIEELPEGATYDHQSALDSPFAILLARGPTMEYLKACRLVAAAHEDTIDGLFHSLAELAVILSTYIACRDKVPLETVLGVFQSAVQDYHEWGRSQLDKLGLASTTAPEEPKR